MELLSEVAETPSREVLEITPMVIAEGRVSVIDLDILECDVQLLRSDDKSPLVLTFRGEDGFWINIYDHRTGTIEAFRKEGLGGLDEIFSAVPCLCACRVKKGQYFVLADIGTPDIADDGEGQGLVLTTLTQLDRKAYRVMRDGNRDALHPATGICLVEPRSAK